MKTPSVVLEWIEEKRQRDARGERQKEQFNEFKSWVQNFVPEDCNLRVSIDYTGVLTHVDSGSNVTLDAGFFKNLTPKNVASNINTYVATLRKGNESEETDGN